MTPQALDAAALKGGIEIEVIYVDQSRERVLVRYLAARYFYQWVDLINHEASLVELFAAKPAGWADNLRHESFVNVLQIGKELNFDRLVAWAERQLAMKEKYAAQLKAINEAIRINHRGPN